MGSKREADSAASPATLSHLFDQARRAWPGVALPLEVFIAQLAASRSDDEDLATRHAPDVFLACACARGDPRALAYFEQHLMTHVSSHVARIDPSPSFADEVKERLRDKLFVAEPGGAPKIASYSGRGPLGGWLRVTAIRAARNLRRGRAGAAQSDRAVYGLAAEGADPEQEYVKRRYSSMLRDVVEAVLRRLPRDEADVLRMHFVDGLTVRAIGSLYRVNASTITRWIARARQEIVDETRARLRDQLVIDDRELDSLLALIESRLDLTLSRVLQPRRAGRRR